MAEVRYVLQDLINALEGSSAELKQTAVPVIFQDTIDTHRTYVDEYHALLADKKYTEAYIYRTETHPEIEPYIVDANKLNVLVALSTSSFLLCKEEKNAANTLYDNAETGLDADTVQEAIDHIMKQGVNTIELTLAEYNALEAAGEIRSGIMYFITDEEIGYSGYLIKEVKELPNDAAEHPKTIYMIIGE